MLIELLTILTQDGTSSGDPICLQILATKNKAAAYSAYVTGENVGTLNPTMNPNCHSVPRSFFNPLFSEPAVSAYITPFHSVIDPLKLSLCSAYQPSSHTADNVAPLLTNRDRSSTIDGKNISRQIEPSKPATMQYHIRARLQVNTVCHPLRTTVLPYHFINNNKTFFCARVYVFPTQKQQ